MNRRLSLFMVLLWTGTVLSFARQDKSMSSAPANVSAMAVQNDSLILAVDSYQLIYLSTDSVHWEVVDFNSEYQEYYGWTTLVHVAASDYDFMILGMDSEGMPVAFTSAQGRVWSPRPLEYPVGSGFERLKQMPVRLVYDKTHERYEACMKNGDRLLLPACSHCNNFVPLQ